MKTPDTSVAAQAMANAIPPYRRVGSVGERFRGTLRNENNGTTWRACYLRAAKVVCGQRQLFFTEKSNEISATQALLRKADIQGALVTADAMHTQTETARIIVQEKGADYLFTVKGNRKTVAESVRQLKQGLEHAFSPSA